MYLVPYMLSIRHVCLKYHMHILGTLQALLRRPRVISRAAGCGVSTKPEGERRYVTAHRQAWPELLGARPELWAFKVARAGSSSRSRIPPRRAAQDDGNPRNFLSRGGSISRNRFSTSRRGTMQTNTTSSDSSRA